MLKLIKVFVVCILFPNLIDLFYFQILPNFSMKITAIHWFLYTCETFVSKPVKNSSFISNLYLFRLVICVFCQFKLWLWLVGVLMWWINLIKNSMIVVIWLIMTVVVKFFIIVELLFAYFSIYPLLLLLHCSFAHQLIWLLLSFHPPIFCFHFLTGLLFLTVTGIFIIISVDSYHSFQQFVSYFLKY